MKANEAPEKIWIDNLGGFWFDIPSGNKSIEYTRTDAFIEKALKWIEENICEYCEGENIIFTADNTQYIDIFNQEEFIEEFKKYIKGE